MRKNSFFTFKNFILILAFSFILYGNTVTHSYNLDDYFVIRENKQVLKGISAIPQIFSSNYFENSQVKFGYRPVTKAIFALEVSIFGNNVAVHHFFNVFYYALLCFLMLILLSKIFVGYAKLYIWAILIFWMFHPIHTEVVNSLKNREEIIYIIFSIISILNFIKYLDKDKILNLVLGLFFFILSYLTKESAISFSLSLPLILTFIVLNEKKVSFKITTFRYELLEILKNKYIFKILIISLSVLILTYALYKLPKILFPIEKIDLLEFENPLHTNPSITLKLSLVMYSLIFYLKMFVFPYPLLFYYGLYKVPKLHFTDFIIVVSIFINAFILFLCIRYWKKYKESVFGILLFYLMIFPFINYLIPINGIVAERFLNAPSLGLSIAFVSLLMKKSNLLNNNSIKKIKNSLKFIYIFVILIFTIITWNRNKHWKDEITLYSHDINYLENSVKANDILAQVIMDRVVKNANANKTTPFLKESLDSAIRYWKQSLKLYPFNAKAYNNIANIYLNFYKNIDSTLFYLNKGYEINPKSFHINFNIGYCYEILKKDSIAIKYYKKALKIDSINYLAWIYTINTYFRLNWNDSAFLYAKKMLEKYPESDFPYSSIGYYYFLKNDTLTALQYWEKSFKINPNNQQRALSLYKYFLKKGDSVKANYYYKFVTGR
ncbi:MAG: hypothetical protein N3A01_02375 [Bacteroidales bacterium]|nr:hypothetical protein [Bacteroidales bacterium]